MDFLSLAILFISTFFFGIDPFWSNLWKEDSHITVDLLTILYLFYLVYILKVLFQVYLLKVWEFFDTIHQRFSQPIAYYCLKERAEDSYVPTNIIQSSLLPQLRYVFYQSWSQVSVLNVVNFLSLISIGSVRKSIRKWIHFTIHRILSKTFILIP